MEEPMWKEPILKERSALKLGRAAPGVSWKVASCTVIEAGLRRVSSTTATFGQYITIRQKFRKPGNQLGCW
jgi:hypothetical protein